MFWAPVVACEISDSADHAAWDVAIRARLDDLHARPTRAPPWAASPPPLAIAAGPGRDLDLQRRRLVVDLERRVVDVEALVEQALERPAQLVAVVAGPDDDVRRERRETRGDLPHVEIVDLDDPGVSGQRVPDLIRIEPGWRGLHEHSAGGLEQVVGGAQHQPGDQQRGDCVRPVEPGGEDHRAGDRRRDEAVQVGEDVPVGALDVQAASVVVAVVASRIRAATRLTTMPASATASTTPP